VRQQRRIVFTVFEYLCWSNQNQSKMEKKKLNHYDVAEVIDRFEINKVFDCFTLKNWLAIG
jgi:hypothetical protein